VDGGAHRFRHRGAGILIAFQVTDRGKERDARKAEHSNLARLFAEFKHTAFCFDRWIRRLEEGVSAGKASVEALLAGALGALSKQGFGRGNNLLGTHPAVSPPRFRQAGRHVREAGKSHTAARPAVI